MKTPKEYAKELTIKFIPYAYCGACEEDDKEMELLNARKCAIISCKEVLSYIGGAVGGCEFWTNVLYELEHYEDRNI